MGGVGRGGMKWLERGECALNEVLYEMFTWRELLLNSS